MARYWMLCCAGRRADRAFVSTTLLQVVAESYIETHEEAAESLVWASAGVLLLMAVPLALPRGRPRQALLLGALVGTLIVFGAL